MKIIGYIQYIVVLYNAFVFGMKYMDYNSLIPVTLGNRMQMYLVPHNIKLLHFHLNHRYRWVLFPRFIILVVTIHKLIHVLCGERVYICIRLLLYKQYYNGHVVDKLLVMVSDKNPYSFSNVIITSTHPYLRDFLSWKIKIHAKTSLAHS